MSEPTKANSVNSQTARSRFSLDAWAVTLALALAILVWSGVIKHIPW
jgi:hypothetical protein